MRTNSLLVLSALLCCGLCAAGWASAEEATPCPTNSVPAVTATPGVVTAPATITVDPLYIGPRVNELPPTPPVQATSPGPLDPSLLIPPGENAPLQTVAPFSPEANPQSLLSNQPVSAYPQTQAPPSNCVMPLILPPSVPTTPVQKHPRHNSGPQAALFPKTFAPEAYMRPTMPVPNASYLVLPIQLPEYEVVSAGGFTYTSQPKFETQYLVVPYPQAGPRMPARATYIGPFGVPDPRLRGR
jgi:hypothetical protein